MPPHPDDPIPRFRKQRMINGAICNRKAAAEYYRLAAKRGHARAQGRLGEMYRNGNAVPKNQVAAHMWLSLSLAGMEALTGFVLITWTASYLYIEMSRTWGVED